MSRLERAKGIVGTLVAVFSSLRLTVTLLGLCMILIFVATLLQVELGIHEVQQLHFRSWIAWFDVWPGTGKFSIPFPGGMLLGALLLANLLAAHIRRFELKWRKVGLILVHAGIILMLLGELFTALFSAETQMRLDEGKSSSHSVDPREIELAIFTPGTDGLETVHAIPMSRLRDGAVFGFGNFRLRVLRFFRNSEILDAVAADSSYDPLRADKSMGTDLAVKSIPRATAMDMRDLSSAFVEIETPDGKKLGRWLLSNAMPGTQEFEVQGRRRTMAIRQERHYHPFSLRLLDFTHERYLGTQIPKNFSSRVRLTNPETGEDRETLIYMNHPLRYGGLTFYQSGFDNNDNTSILQVVRNPAWTMPYVSCAMVGLGLAWIFSQHLIRAISLRRRKPSAA